MESTSANQSERTRQMLSDGEGSDDAARLQLLEELYRELEHELDRDFGQAS